MPDIELRPSVQTPTASGRNTVAVGSHHEGGSGIRKDHRPWAMPGQLRKAPEGGCHATMTLNRGAPPAETRWRVTLLYTKPLIRLQE
jgi:hypothetical protein